VIISELDPLRKSPKVQTNTIFLKNLSFKSRESHIKEAFD